LHNIHAGYYGTTEPTGHPSDAWGFAIAGGIQLKNLPTGPGDKLSLEATYTDGAPKYVIGGTTGNNFDAFSNSGTSSPAFYQTFASLALFDGVYTTNGSIEKTKVWGFRGGYEHNWSPNWQTSLFGSYTRMSTTTRTQRPSCGAPTLLHSTRRRQQLQPGFQHLAGRFAHGMDPGQEPDLLGRNHVHDARPEQHRWHHCAGSWRGWPLQAGRRIRVQGSGHPVRQLPRPPHLVIAAR
jgi:hypothetical protein